MKLRFLSKLICVGDLAYLVCPLIPLRWMFAWARTQGRFQYLVYRKQVSAVRGNLLTVLGESTSKDEVESLTRKFFEDKQLRGLLVYLLPRFNAPQAHTFFPIEGLEHLDRALSKRRGVILLLSHLNSIIGLVGKDVLRRKGYDVRIAFPTRRLAYTPTLFRKMIERLWPAGANATRSTDFFAQFNIRPIVRALEERAIVIFTGDGWHSASFVQVEFLGRPIFFTTGAMSVARLTGAPVVPFFVTGSPPDQLKLSCEEPILVENTGDSGRDLETMVGNYARRLEYHLRRNIPAWQHWLEDRALDKMSTMLDQPLSVRYRM